MYRKAPPDRPVQLLTHSTPPRPGIDSGPRSFSGDLSIRAKRGVVRAKTRDRGAAMIPIGPAGQLWIATHQNERDRRLAEERLGRLAARWTRRRWLAPGRMRGPALEEPGRIRPSRTRGSGSARENGYARTMTIDEEAPRAGSTGTPEADEPTGRPAEASPLDRGLAPPSVEPEITSTHALDRGLAPPDDEGTEDTGETSRP
ncbi:hypothetical protein QRX60_31225 [Amycolatopsis mongoliensis]|uniref:Uncharacterized protein n=1 Tax=Amycolatopsis mongoliensis TaxID=715475 RepID=A0A9Y2JH45_9PSEU|nr:hypothetical protein [Amycolatopsis sp. 4-36]WIX98525.1 hypothetical protein QRX60_31225 [Amycolatopsis sp. 4-36]